MERLNVLEVNQLDVVVHSGEEKDVFRLQIHVNQLRFVKIADSRDYLSDDLSSLDFGHEHLVFDVVVDLLE